MSLAEDFHATIVEYPEDVERFVNANVVLTGGSGFVGQWLVGVWLAGCGHLGGSGRLLVTSRNPHTVIERFPEIRDSKRVQLVASDVRILQVDRAFNPSILIHAATSASEKLNIESPFEMIDVITRGTERVIKLAQETGIQKIVNLSSGAVYGHAPIGARPFKETDHCGPDLTNPRNAYHEGKRLAELTVNIAASAGDLSVVSLRLFAFLAPFLPLDTHFVAGYFLRQAVNNQKILISSGGNSVRSYLYGSDLAGLIIRAATRELQYQVYNVGGFTPVTISQLARLTKEVLNSSSEIEITGRDLSFNSSTYIPDMTRTANEFGCIEKVSLEEAITRTARWYLLNRDR